MTVVTNPLGLNILSSMYWYSGFCTQTMLNKQIIEAMMPHTNTMLAIITSVVSAPLPEFSSTGAHSLGCHWLCYRLHLRVFFIFLHDYYCFYCRYSCLFVGAAVHEPIVGPQQQDYDRQRHSHLKQDGARTLVEEAVDVAVDVGEERLCRIGFADDIAVDGDIEQYLAHIVGKPHLGQILPAQSGTQHGYLLPIGHGGAVALEQRGDHSRVAAGVHDVQDAAVQIDVVDQDIEVAPSGGPQS